MIGHRIVRWRTPHTAARTRRRGVLARLLMVLALVILPAMVGPGSPVAAASGFDCKDVPAPEFPNSAFETNFDSASADQTPIQPGPGVAPATGYQTYGWAGLKWYTYDLGCGSDLVRAPRAVGDTALGNTFMTVGKSMAAAAFWLDDQTNTSADSNGALAQFGRIIDSIVTSMLGIYGIWLGIGLSVVAAIILWRALKADTAGVTRAAGIAAIGLALGAFMVGAPQKAIKISDHTFGALITDSQHQIFSMAFGHDGKGNPESLQGGPTDPRNVLMDRIYLPDWTKGWFGTNYDDSKDKLEPALRDSLAFSYAEQREIEHPRKDGTVAVDTNTESKIAAAKANKFRDIIKHLSDKNLSYYTFQGKDSGRTSIGLMCMIKMAMPSLLWIGASILKLTALLAIRFAILFAPIWVPIAVAHGGLLSRVLRMLASAYMWGVAGAVIVALYLMALVQLYVNDNGAVDGSWRLWFMVLLTVVCWVIMRPFKRLTQTFAQNHASLINRKARNAQKSLKRKLFDAASFAVGGPTQAIAEKAVEGFADDQKRGRSYDKSSSISPVRPEGRGLDNRRRHELDSSRAQARKQSLVGRAERLGQAAKDVEERDARIAGIAAAASSDLARGKGNLDQRDVEQAGAAGAGAWRRLDKDETDEQSSERRARKDLVSAAVGQRWDGGDGSAIAPMKIYTSNRGKTSAGITPMMTITRTQRGPAAEDKKRTTAPRLWDASLRPSTPLRNTERYN